jgi:hypothetical protein
MVFMMLCGLLFEVLKTPFALSLSKGSLGASREGFDRLSPNGRMCSCRPELVEGQAQGKRCA